VVHTYPRSFVLSPFSEKPLVALKAAVRMPTGQVRVQCGAAGFQLDLDLIAIGEVVTRAGGRHGELWLMVAVEAAAMSLADSCGGDWDAAGIRDGGGDMTDWEAVDWFCTLC